MLTCAQKHKAFPDKDMTHTDVTEITYVLCTHTTTTTWYPQTPMVRGFHDNDTSLAIQPPTVPELTPKHLLGLSEEG